MELNQKEEDALLSIFGYEQAHNPRELILGWNWSAVRVAPATLNNLLLKGLLEEKFHSNSYRGLLLTHLGQEQVQLLMQPMKVYEEPQHKELTLPNDIFEDIVDGFLLCFLIFCIRDQSTDCILYILLRIDKDFRFFFKKSK